MGQAWLIGRLVTLGLVQRAGTPLLGTHRRPDAAVGGPGHAFLRRHLRPGPVTVWELAALGALVAALVVVWAWVTRVPLLLGHDESVYAVMARHWHTDAPGTGVALHRAPLLPALGVPVLALGGGELGLRLWGLAAGVGGLLATWWVGRLVAGAVAGLVAASVYSLAPSVLDQSTYFLTDVPAAAVLVALAGVLWWQFATRPAPDRRLLLVAPMAWAAYLFRYGSALVVVLLFLTTLVVFWPTVRAHVRLVMATLGLLALLLVPHFVNATTDMGLPWQRLVYTSRLSGRDFLGQGLVQYVQWFPDRLAGPLAAALMAAGLVGTAVVALRARVWSRGRAWLASPDGALVRGLTFLVVPAVGHVVAIGLASHGEPRFVFFAVSLLCVTGAVVVTRVLDWTTGWSGPLVPGPVVGGTLVWAALAAFGVVMMLFAAVVARTESRQRSSEQREHRLVLVASEHLQDVSGPECSVLTTYTPQVTWYASCRSYHFGSPPVVGRERYLTEDAWMLLFQGGKRQPEGEVLQSYLDIAEPAATWDIGSDDDFGRATLYRVTQVPDAR